MISSWEDITIRTWQELNRVQSDNEVSTIIETISILTDKDPHELRNMKINEFRDLQSEFSWSSIPPKPDIQVKFEIDGKNYGMIPQLDFITAGEWLDAESWKDDSVSNIHYYAALLYRPIVKDDGLVYSIEEHKTAGFIERANLFLERLPITRIYGLVIFFSTFGLNFMQIIQDYLPQIIQENSMKMTQTQILTKTQEEQSSQKDGGSMI